MKAKNENVVLTRQLCERLFLMSFNVAGFSYYDGPFVFSDLKVGAAVELRCEFENRHDADAIAVYFAGKKIGFVPADRNEKLHIFLEQGYADIFEAVISRVVPEQHLEQQLLINVYVKSRD